MWNLKWTYEGVDPNIPGNGGPECAHFSSLFYRVLEAILVVLLSTLFALWGWKRVRIDYRCSIGGRRQNYLEDGHTQQQKKILLVLMCLLLGCELGFKFSSKTLIYILNPCHIVTIVQIYLLLAPPSRLVTVLFRWHLHSLNGAVLAIAFPVLNTRLLPFEVTMYYLQHLMMLVIPFYLIRIGGVYSTEKLADFSWSILTLSSWLFYHFIPLSIISLLTEVNLNCMLCPAISDPFCGTHYRLWAVGHQSILVSSLGKLYLIVCLMINRFTKPNVMTNCNGCVASN